MDANVSFLFLHLIDELKVGGAQTHLLTLLRAAHRYPYRHKVVSLFGTGPLQSEIEALGIEVIVLDLRPFLQKRRYFACVAELLSLLKKEKPQIVEAHLSWSRLLGLCAATLARTPLRVGFEQGDLYLSSWKWRAVNWVGQFFAHKIIVCSHWLKEWVQQTHAVSSSRLEVFHNCVDPEAFKLSSPASRDTLGLPSHKYLAVTIGTLGKGIPKHIDVCLQALAEARKAEPELALVVCGEGELRGQLEALANQLGLKEHVRFLGNRRDIAAILSHSTVFCHAAPLEPFGIVCLEALACGVPVVIPDSGGMAEIAPHNVAGLHYPALDVYALSDSLLRLCHQPHTRMRMIKAGAQILWERFSVQKYIPRLYALYGLPELAENKNHHDAAPIKLMQGVAEKLNGPE